MKKIKLYVISKCPLGSTDDEFRNNIVTFVTEKKQVIEYVNKRLIVDHYDHYKQWCEVHNLDICNPDAENEYLKTVGATWDDYCQYTFKKFIYNLNEIASIFRITNKCSPVGTSYETAAEIEYMEKYYSYCKQFIDMFQDNKEKSVDK